MFTIFRLIGSEWVPIATHFGAAGIAAALLCAGTEDCYYLAW